MEVISKPVKNYTAGRNGFVPEAIVIHIADGDRLEGTYSWFNNPNSKASSHYGVKKTGVIWQFVKEEDTAWHAGGVANPSWSLLKPGINPNSYTIGIEHEGWSGQPFTTQMYESTGWLIAQICERWNIPLDRDHVIGHYQINSRSRSNCPGSGVDLGKLLQYANKYWQEIQTMIAELQNQITHLKQQLADLQTQKIGMNVQLTSLQAGNAELALKLNEAETSQQELQSQLQSLQQQNQKLLGQLAALGATPI